MASAFTYGRSGKPRAHNPNRSAPRPFLSPIDKAKSHEVVWEQVIALFAAARRISNASFVYVISEGDDGPVKIGKAKDPVQRLRTMQTGNPRRLRLEYVLLGERMLERLLHEIWEPSAIRSVEKRGKSGTSPGTEWFEAKIRPELFGVLDVAVKRQVEYLGGDGEKAFERAAEIVYEAHVSHATQIHERDEVRLLARGAGNVITRGSVVQHFRLPPRDDYTWERLVA